jgi:hypothetical protein
MNWIKKSLSIGFVVIILNGCGGATFGPSLAKSLGMIPNPDDGRVYLEKVDNNLFIDHIVKFNIIKNLSLDKIIYIDNVLTSIHANRSYKILFTKNYFYLVSHLDTDNFLKSENTGFKVEKYSYVSHKYYFDTKLEDYVDWGYSDNVYKSTTKLILIKISKVIRKSLLGFDLGYEKIKIYHRFNNIYKIKEIIDERVAYHRKQQLKER